MNMTGGGFGNGGFGTAAGTTKQFQVPSFRKKPEGDIGLGEDPFSLKDNPFNSLAKKKTAEMFPGSAPSYDPQQQAQQANSALQTMAQKTSANLMSGATPGFDEQASITREAARYQQAARDKAAREALLNSGLGNTGAFVRDELGSANQNMRERISTERDLAAQRGQLQSQNQQAGIAGATSLLNIASQEKMQDKQIGSTEKLGFADLSIREKQLQQNGSQFNTEMDFKKYALQAGFTENEAQRTWQAIQNDKQIASGEKVAGMNIDADKWKTLRMEDLTKQGWTQEAAMAEADRKWKSGEATLDRIQEMAVVDKNSTIQKDLVTLKGKIDEGLLIKGNEFDSIERDLDRKHEIAKQAGDIQGQREIEALRGEIQTARDNADREWQSGERVASQVYNSLEKIDDRTHEQAMKYVDSEIREAEATKDTDRQMQLMDYKSTIDLKFQQNDMNHDEKMADIKAKIDEAAANNDVGRQQTLMSYKANIDVQNMYAQFDVDTAKMKVDGAIQQALKESDYKYAATLQQQRFVHEGTIEAMQITERQADRALQKLGMDRQQVETMLENGVIDGDTFREWMGAQGVNLAAPDPLAYQKEATAKHNQMLATWAQTHPDKVEYLPDGTIRAKDGSFNDYVNEVMYNEKAAKAGASRLAAADPNDMVGASQAGHPLNADYQDAMSKAQEWTPTGKVDNQTLGFGGVNKFTSNIPTINSAIKKDGKLYIVQSAVQEERGGTGSPSKQYIEALDVDGASTIRIYADNSQGKGKSLADATLGVAKYVPGPVGAVAGVVNTGKKIWDWLT